MSAGVTLLDGLTVRCVGSALSVRFAGHLLGQLGADVTSHAAERARSEYRYPWAEAVAERPSAPAERTVNVVAAADLKAFDVAAGLEQGDSVVWISADATD
ncbi:MAG: hypothetical protein QOE91_1440, partial [Gaiellaceae bacterium]|nr:hypothetical protein [Gaiellaceae bacterium]